MVYEFSYGLLALFLVALVWFVFIKDDEEVDEVEEVKEEEKKSVSVNPLQWIYCNTQGGNCNKKGQVKFGQGDNWSYMDNPDGNITCNVATFGDPSPGIDKKCFFLRDEPLRSEKGGKCGPDNKYRRCGSNRYCSSTGYCGTSASHKRNSYGKYSGPDTHWYVY